MKSSNKLYRRVVLALLTLGVAAAGLGFTLFINEETQLPIKWPAGNIRLRIMLGDTKILSDGLNYNTVAKSAAGTWSAVIGAVQFETELLPAGQATEQSGSVPAQIPINEMAFAADIYGRTFGDALAVTTVWSRGNERGEADIIFNTAYQWDSYLGPMRTNGVIDLRRVALHELRHVLGLGHSDAPGQVNPPSSIMSAQAGDLYILRDDDLAGARSLYGPPSGPANDNFANAFPIIMAGNRSVTVTGHNTKATQEPGDPRQGDNPGGRSVWWRWMAPSAGNVILDTKGSYYDTTLGVYTGTTLANLVRVADNDDIDPGVRQNSSLSFTATAGTQYRIAVDGYNAIEQLPSDTAGADNGGITLNLAFDGSLGTAPAITTQPVSATIVGGSSASLSVIATGSAPLNYQWFLDDSAISGATNSTLSVLLRGAYTVSVTNAAGSVTSNSATISWAVVASAPPPSSSGGGGGGGAPSLWFLACLAVLGLVRLRP